MSADTVLDALGFGSRTHRVAARLGWTTAKTRRVLCKLEREGRVERSARYTASNDIYWLRSTKWQERIQHDPYGCPYIGTPKPCPLCDCARRALGRFVDSERVARVIESAEITPIIKQRLIAELVTMTRDSDAGSAEDGDSRLNREAAAARAEGIARD